MKNDTVKVVIIISWIFILLLALLSGAVFLSQTGMVYYFNKHIQFKYTVTEKKSVAYYFQDEYTLRALEERIKTSNLSISEKNKIYNDPSSYNIVNIELDVKNDTDFYIMIKPHFKDSENVWFVKKQLELLSGDDSRQVGCMPNDVADWSFCAIEKLDAFESEIKPEDLKSLICAQIIHGPYVSMFYKRNNILLYGLKD